MRDMRTMTLSALFFLLLAQGAAAAERLILSPVDEHALAVLGNNVPSEAVAENDRGVVPDGLFLRQMTLLLRRPAREQGALEHLLEAQTERTSPKFHRWLTAREFGERFGPARSDVAALARWLTAKRFHVDPLAASRRTITFSGTAGQVRAAFHVSIHRLLMGGATHFSNMAAPQMPAALARAVMGIVSLNDFMPYADVQKYTFMKFGKLVHAVVPDDLAMIYNLNPLFGAGLSGQVRD